MRLAINLRESFGDIQPIHRAPIYKCIKIKRVSERKGFETELIMRNCRVGDQVSNFICKRRHKKFGPGIVDRHCVPEYFFGTNWRSDPRRKQPRVKFNDGL